MFIFCEIFNKHNVIEKVGGTLMIMHCCQQTNDCLSETDTQTSTPYSKVNTIEVREIETPYFEVHINSTPKLCYC